MKQFLSIAITALLLAMVAGCGSNEAVNEKEPEIIIEDKFDDKSEDVSVNNDEEIKKFAQGVSEEGADSEKENQGDVKVDGTISEKCNPKAVLMKPDIKYPKYVHETYESTTCKRERGFNILLPETYDESKSYPVMYLLHGIFGDEYSMTDSANKTIEMVTNLAAAGIIEETIIVCPNMFAADNDEIKPGFSAEQCVPYDNFIYDLINDLMPYIESHYSVKTGRENTMLAGFSMGGRETLYIALTRPELFGYVCAIAPAPGVTPGKDNFMPHSGQMSEEEFRFADGAIVPDVFMITAGTNDSVVGKFPKGYHELLETNGVDHIWYEVEGADHDNTTIKSGLYNLFMQMAYSKQNK